jgi:hypothetical protein
MRPARFGAAVAAIVLLAGCGSGPPPQQHREDEWRAPVEILEHYADKDGNVTRAGLEAGLRRDFDAADVNHNGVLDPDEVRAVNQQRWTSDQSAVSPLQDWNGDGVVDFAEFSATARALFQQYDRNGNGVLTPAEMRPGRSGQDRPDGDAGGGDRQGPEGGPPRGGRGGGPH